jgi:hypothetical protein
MEKYMTKEPIFQIKSSINKELYNKILERVEEALETEHVDEDVDDAIINGLDEN